jgi:hypothetical protein
MPISSFHAPPKRVQHGNLVSKRYIRRAVNDRRGAAFLSARWYIRIEWVSACGANRSRPLVRTGDSIEDRADGPGSDAATGVPAPNRVARRKLAAEAKRGIRGKRSCDCC